MLVPFALFPLICDKYQYFNQIPVRNFRFFELPFFTPFVMLKVPQQCKDVNRVSSQIEVIFGTSFHQKSNCRTKFWFKIEDSKNGEKRRIISLHSNFTAVSLSNTCQHQMVSLNFIIQKFRISSIFLTFWSKFLRNT